MVFSFASKFQFLDNTQNLLLKWYNDAKFSKTSIRDDPKDLEMMENIMPYIRDVSLPLPLMFNALTRIMNTNSVLATP